MLDTAGGDLNVFTAHASPSGVRGTPRVPGDKSVSHRCLLLAARAEGRSVIRGLSGGDDVSRTLKAIRSFGAEVWAEPQEVTVDGGAGRLREPASVIDVGNSGTAIRLITGWACGVEGLTVLTGDESVARRPMGRVVDPLRKMGARIDGRGDGDLAPLVVRGGSLRGIDYRMPVPSAQVKGAVLLAGICAEGETTVREQSPTRMHTEELLSLAGADISSGDGWVTVRRSRLVPLDVTVPGDPSQAAFWVVAACITPGSEVVLPGIYVGQARAGFLDVLRRMGANIEVVDRDEVTATATIVARHSELRATEVGGDEVPSLIDEIPVLAVAAAHAQGTTTFSGAAELRVKETDRVETMVAALRAVGAKAEPLPDGLAVEGRAGVPLDGGRISSAGDHRVAMSLAVAALASRAPIVIDGWNAVATSYPGFEEEYARCAS